MNGRGARTDCDSEASNETARIHLCLMPELAAAAAAAWPDHAAGGSDGRDAESGYVHHSPGDGYSAAVAAGNQAGAMTERARYLLDLNGNKHGSNQEPPPAARTDESNAHSLRPASMPSARQGGCTSGARCRLRSWPPAGPPRRG